MNVRTQRAKQETTGEDPEPTELDQILATELDDPVFAEAYADATVRAELLIELVELRQSRAMAQATVAEHMGTTQSAVSELEGGATDPRLSTLQRYARAIGARIEVRVCDETPAPHAPRSSRRVTMKP